MGDDQWVDEALLRDHAAVLGDLADAARLVGEEELARRIAGVHPGWAAPQAVMGLMAALTGGDRARMDRVLSAWRPATEARRLRENEALGLRVEAGVARRDMLLVRMGARMAAFVTGMAAMAWLAANGGSEAAIIATFLVTMIPVIPILVWFPLAPPPNYRLPRDYEARRQRAGLLRRLLFFV